MKILELEQNKVDIHDFIRRPAADSDYKELIKEDVIIVDPETKQPRIVYITVKDLPGAYNMIKILKGIEYQENKRVAGLLSRSRIFGYMPKEQIRKDYCSATSLARESPKEHKAVCDFGIVLSKYYKEHCPDMFKYHMELAGEKVLPDWRIAYNDTPFTSGIINKNNMLKYHKDAGNFDKVYSNMVCFRKDCSGGHLSLPEYDIGLEISNKSLLFFDGQSIIHGVTPFKITGREGYRYTMVYYTLKQMWQCKPIGEELARIKSRKTERELKRYHRLTGELDDFNDFIKK